MIIGLFLKHIKVYKGINFIPIGEKYKFVSYIGENGIGKSSILDSLDSFFNNKSYSINKSAINDGIYTIGNEPFITPIFLIEKSKVTRKKKEFEKISNIFWNISKRSLSSRVQGSTSEFFELRESLLEKYSSEEYYLLLVGETNLQASPKIYFGSFHGDEHFISHLIEENLEKNEKKERLDNLLLTKPFRDFFTELKNLYSYVYLPVEINVESFTKMETDEMQKIFDKKLKNQIQEALKGINLDKSNGINKRLNSFVDEIKETLNSEYYYDTGQSRNNKLTKLDLVDKILEVYFQKRILYKQDGKIQKKVSELSAGEKRQALINLVYAFLKRNNEREKMIIIAIDEPENSLHMTLCYDQFEKLKTISRNNQILLTTHWYGFLPVINDGYGHFLNLTDHKVNFSTYDLLDYKSKVKSEIKKSKNRIFIDSHLKSINDLVQSIYYSIKADNPYNWIICEGLSDKIYLEYFFKDEIKSNKFRVISLGGRPEVIRLYKHLKLPVDDGEISDYKGKIYCLIDTDPTRIEGTYNCNGILKIMRLSNEGTNNGTKLLNLNHSDMTICDIEQSLNPILFKETVEALNCEVKYQVKAIENELGNTSFIKNFKNLELEGYFRKNNGDNKITFAKKYIEVFNSESDQEKYIPNWIKEMKEFFKNDG